MDRLLLLAAALLFSTGGFVIKQTSLTAWQVAGFRSVVAAAFLFLLLPSARQAFRWSLLPVSFAYAAMLLSFVVANKLTTAANAIFLQSTAPLYLAVLGPVLLHEKLRRSDLLLMAAVAAGMALFFIGEERISSTAPNPTAGNWIACGCAIAWAFTIAGIRWLVRGRGNLDFGGAAVIAGNALAFLAALPLALPLHSVAAADVGSVFYLGIFQVGLAYVCLNRALQTVPAIEASIILLIEPVLNPIWTWLRLGEEPSRLAIAGGAIILSATLINTWLRARRVLRLPNGSEQT